jgi:hypothetical protein
MIPIDSDNGGRRLSIDRRQYSYLAHLPERRSGKDRRSGSDRRCGIGSGFSKEKERRAVFYK